MFRVPVPDQDRHNRAGLRGARFIDPAGVPVGGSDGRRLTLTNDEAYQLIMDVARGKLDSVDEIAAVLAAGTKPRQ
jgi:hypothetical protein